jgi:hypothetical protein
VVLVGKLEQTGTFNSGGRTQHAAAESAGDDADDAQQM